ncbi:hypothetical protein C789_756 [Microcystis aeruginosa FACHB-905 = DIANCHI905]|nr:hypothetical protein C789_756 [Microcystis aeruginosa FACHB-905 = DIANCHI905]
MNPREVIFEEMKRESDFYIQLPDPKARFERVKNVHLLMFFNHI